MINIQIDDENNKATIETNGKLHSIISDLARAISYIHASLLTKEPDATEVFREFFTDSDNMEHIFILGALEMFEEKVKPCNVEANDRQKEKKPSKKSKKPSDKGSSITEEERRKYAEQMIREMFHD